MPERPDATERPGWPQQRLAVNAAALLYRFELSSAFSARLGNVGPGTVAVPGATGPLCRGAAPKRPGRGGSVCANAGPATMIMTAATLKTLIMTVSMPKGLRSRQRGALRWSKAMTTV